MKCIVRTRKNNNPDVFIPKGRTAEYFLEKMYEKEKNILSAKDEIDEDISYINNDGALVYTETDNWTEFYVTTLVEVEDDNY